MISPKAFEKFALPYLIEYHTKLVEMGIPGIILDLCGQQTANYELYPQIPLTPLSMVSVSHEVDLELAMEKFPNNIIVGNIEPALIQLGKPSEVYEACRIAIKKGKTHKRGFALAPGCELPPRTPPRTTYG